MTSNLLETIGNDLEDYIRRKANVDLLLRMDVNDSVARNLKAEDAEMVHDYNRQVRILDGKNAKELEIPDDEDNEMKVAGDIHVTIPPEKTVPQPVTTQQPPTGNPLMQSILSAVAGAGILGGGIWAGNAMSGDTEPEKPAAVAPVMKDTDTIGVLEPDKG